MKNALIVVDVQNDFCEGGSLGVTGGNAVASQIALMVASTPVVFDFFLATRDWHSHDLGVHFKEWPVHCVKGTRGAQFHPDLDPAWFDAIFSKGDTTAAYSGFEGWTDDGAGLAQWLRAFDVTEVEIVGIATDYCVRATALDAVKEGFKTRVLMDLTAAVGGEDGKATTAQELEAAGVIIG